MGEEVKMDNIFREHYGKGNSANQNLTLKDQSIKISEQKEEIERLRGQISELKGKVEKEKIKRLTNPTESDKMLLISGMAGVVISIFLSSSQLTGLSILGLKGYAEVINIIILLTSLTLILLSKLG